MLRFFRTNTGDLSDEELLERYKQSSDASHLSMLFDRYLEMVYGVGLKYFKNPTEAEEVVMGVFEQVLKKALQHDVRNFRSWLHVLSKNYCLMQLRKWERKHTTFMEPSLMQFADSRHLSFDLEDDTEKKALLDCIKKLPEKQKDCIRLFYYEDKSYKEIAEMKGQELGKIRSYLQNGRRNLKICMEKKG